MLTPYNYSGSGRANTPVTPSTDSPSGGSLKPFKYADYTPPPAVVPPPSLLSKTEKGVSDYADASAATVPGIIKTAKDVFTQSPLKSLVDFGNFVSQPAKDAVTAGGEDLYNLATDKGVSNKVADTANLISHVAGAAFSPLTGAFNVADKIPGAKQAADALNIPFTALGAAGSWSSGAIIDHLPIPQASKDIIKAPLQGLSSLAAQVVFGGKVADHIGLLAKNGAEITPEIAQKIVDQVKSEVSPETTTPGFQPLKTPEELHTDYARSQGYEPYTSPDQLPTIDVGKPGKEALPTIQTEPPINNKLGDLTVEPIVPNPVESKAPVSRETPAVGVSPTSGTVPTEPVIEAGAPAIGRTTSGVAKRIEASAIENELTKSGYDELASYEGTTRDAQAKAIKNLYDSGIERVISVLRGGEALPEDLRSGALVKFTEQYIKDNPKDPLTPELSHALANSEHTGAFSQAGSELSAGRGFADTASGKLEAIKKAREARIPEATKKRSSTRKAVASAVDGVNLPPEDLGPLQKFIEDNLC